MRTLATMDPAIHKPGLRWVVRTSPISGPSRLPRRKAVEHGQQRICPAPSGSWLPSRTSPFCSPVHASRSRGLVAARPHPWAWEPGLVRTDVATGGRNDRSMPGSEGWNMPSLFLEQTGGEPGWVERPSAHRRDPVTRRSSHRGAQTRAQNDTDRLGTVLRVVSGALRSGFLQQLLLFGGAALLLLVLGASASALHSPVAVKVNAVATRIAAIIPREALIGASVTWFAVMPLAVVLRRTSEDASRVLEKLSSVLGALERERIAAKAPLSNQQRPRRSSAAEADENAAATREGFLALIEPGEERAMRIQLAHHRSLVRTCRLWLQSNSPVEQPSTGDNGTFGTFGKTIHWAADNAIITEEQRLEYATINRRGTLVKHDTMLLDWQNEFTIRAPRPLQHVGPAAPAPPHVVDNTLRQVAEHRRLLADLVGRGVEVPVSRSRRLVCLIDYAEANNLISVERAAELRIINEAGIDAKHRGF